MALSLKADRRTPALLGGYPFHPRDTAGIVGADGFGLEHFHAGAIDIVKDQAALGDTGRFLAAAAFCIAAAQASGADIHHAAAVTPAAPGSTAADIFRRTQDGQIAKTLARQIQPVPGVVLSHGFLHLPLL